MLTNARKKITGGDNYLKISSLRYLPRWMVFLIDIFILIISLFISILILHRISQTFPPFFPFQWKYLLIVLINVLCMYFFKTFSGIIRHSTFIDIQKIFLSSILSFVVLFVIKYTSFFLIGLKLFPIPLLLIYFAISFSSLMVFRLVVKEGFSFLRKVRSSTLKRRVLVLGISDVPISVATAITENSALPFEVVGFLTQRHDSKYAKLLGKPIIVKSTLENSTKEDIGIDGVILIKEILEKDELQDWVNLFIEKNIPVFKSPDLKKLKEEKVINPIKNLNIEDLLNRKPIKIENEGVKQRHFGKAILVTGGAGSIGSEIVNQVAQFEPSIIVVLDQAETPLHDIEVEMRSKYPNIKFDFILADISNKKRIEYIFEYYKFSMVYHAAAYKHVPIIEQNPHEGARVNIIGTKNVAELSSKYHVNRFVMISTDKAVNPTNVMGATKRTAELFVQSLQKTEGNTTKFITTRFGNVLGSNGSVIPHFQKQIEKGGPVTITHPDITRYFMTIPEACELVLQAGTMGQGGEIYVFDMGEPVKIIDLAKKMIKLYGFETGVDIQIVTTGLRPGEKLYEELLSDDAKTLPTHHNKIMISKDPSVPFEKMKEVIEDLKLAILRKEKQEVVFILKNLLPEFKSNNSEFEKLDK